MSHSVDNLAGESLISPGEMEYLLSQIPEQGRFFMVEIGTFDGATAANLARSRPNARIISIDPFPPRTSENIAIINPGDVSHWMKNRQPNQLLFVGDAIQFRSIASEYFADAIFIDGDHRYEEVLADLIYSEDMVRMGGSILLHDFDRERPVDLVAKAVAEFCRQRPWKIAEKKHYIARLVRA